MAFELASSLLKNLPKDIKKQFARQLGSFQDWAQEMLEDKIQKELFPEFQSVALEHFRATRLVHKNDPYAVDALKKAASNAKHNNFMLIYVNATLQTKEKSAITEVENMIGDTGLAMYISARTKTDRDYRSVKSTNLTETQ